METKSTWFEKVKNIFKPNEEKLRKEAEERANDVFNLILEDGLSYIVFGKVKVSPATYGNASQELLKTLYELREMYVQQYIANEGRL